MKDFTGEMQQVTASNSKAFNGKIFKIIEADSANNSRPKSIVPDTIRGAAASTLGIMRTKNIQS